MVHQSDMIFNRLVHRPPVWHDFYDLLGRPRVWHALYEFGM